MLTQQYYIDSFSELRKHQALTACDLRRWFSENINSWCLEVCGRAGRQLDRSMAGGTYSIALSEKNNRLFAHIDMVWYFEKQDDALDEHPPLEVLMSLLPDVKMEVAKKHLQNALRADLILALQEWKYFAASLLGSLLYTGYVNRFADTYTASESKREAALILKYVYPDVGLDFLSIAADLGVVEREPYKFTHWFHQYLQGREREPATLSDDIQIV